MDAPDPRGPLRADCASCQGLCCVAPAFAVSADFALDKPAGRPCSNLLVDSRCGIHSSLRDRGFPGCVAFDCLGAGQQTVQVTFAGAHWRDDPRVATAMFDAFALQRQLHEFLWYLVEAQDLEPDAETAAEIRRSRAQVERLTTETPGQLAGLDIAAVGAPIGDLLQRVSARRRRRHHHALQFRGADLAGRRFRGSDLVGAQLRGASMLGADLRTADLADADLLGADLRGADLRGAQLATAFFLTRTALGSARGDVDTTLPAHLERPGHWAGTATPPRRATPPR